MGSLYLGVCVCATDFKQVTDVGLEAFSAAVKASTTIATVELYGTCDRCEYLLELGVWDHFILVFVCAPQASAKSRMLV